MTFGLENISHTQQEIVESDFGSMFGIKGFSQKSINLCASRHTTMTLHREYIQAHKYTQKIRSESKIISILQRTILGREYKDTVYSKCTILSSGDFGLLFLLPFTCFAFSHNKYIRRIGT